MRVLLIEDESRLADALIYIFKKNRFAADSALDGETGEAMAETGIYDIIVLDIMLPGKDGLSVLRSLRDKGLSTPVILLTAKDSIADRVKGLDLGADDYLIKPFATEELLARMRALGRRQTEALPRDTIQIGNVVFDTASGEITCGDRVVSLTQKESQTLYLLMRNRNQVLSKEQILDRVWGLDSYTEANIIEVYLSYIRKKLSTVDSGIVIDTIRGAGYRLREAAKHA